jgi:hypothetical protein
VEVRISFPGGNRVAELESLDGWLRVEPELAGRVSVAGPEPGAGELGVLGDALVVAVGSGGTLSVLAMSLKAWLSQPRRSAVRIRVQCGGGKAVEIDADRVDVKDVEDLLRQALRDDVPREQ